MSRLLFLLFSFTFVLLSCSEKHEELPIYGFKKVVDGKEVEHTIGEIHHYNQDSVLITNKDLYKYVHVADFFFMSCPSICPRVTKEMHRIYEAFKDNPNVKIVSFTIDPKRDTPKALKLYADNLQVDHDKWYFLSGDKDKTFELANSYFVAALEDEESPGGFDHSGKIVLIDKKGHVRAVSEGTDPESTPQMIKDINTLLSSYESNQ